MQIRRIGYLESFEVAAFVEDVSERAVVRRYKGVFLRPHDNGLPPGTYAGIDDGNEYRSRRKIAKAGTQRKGRFENVLRFDLVGNINDNGFRVDRKDSAFDRGYKMVASAEIGKKCNNHKNIRELSRMSIIYGNRLTSRIRDV